jgi:AraC family transcriptional regulator of adaptative response/methylated-DNA-[protein]-cysteine methyltransferase
LAAVVSVCRLAQQAEGAVEVAGMAARLGWSERHLRRRFKDLVGVSIGSYLRAQQAHRARQALLAGASVTDAIYQASYGSARAFYEHGAPRLGMAPARYRSGAQGEHLVYTCVETPLGVAAVACSIKGLCEPHIADDEPTATERLRSEFPRATLERDDAALAGMVPILRDAFQGRAEATALPVDLAGTAFQVRVWEALRAIPAGKTRTYAQVAAAIGRPTAVRAVARACATNPVALVVPCHRVVRSDGAQGGYRWGPALKRALLEAERGLHPPTGQLLDGANRALARDAGKLPNPTAQPGLE